MTIDHPSESELLQFARGELDEVRFEEVAAHVEACAQCSSALEETGAFPNLLDAASPNDLSGKALAAGSSPADLPGTSRTASTLPRSTGISEGPGSIVGPYKLLQQLGEGGMGVVYMAEQEKPVRRLVALKIIKPGMDSRQVIARFEAERQALAMMEHHNIAKVLDAGTTETGRPYFAMELVKGVPFTDYCDKNKLTPRERLEMFIPVCQAIQHAHQKGIIHRDIKPSNVLVTLYDGQPVPKVIDFGIAKATQQKLTERTMFTGNGQILGTMEYMSPEQAEMNQLDIDTRSDVYSLGVMLYELLTGSTPITKDKLRGVGLEEMLRTIRETEPPKPSTRLSDSGEALPTISDVRKTEPTKLSKFVRGDLDWIVMKALEKDRTRRYETASGLAADVQRFLSDEAVEACPPSARYKLRKFARRNKAALITGVAITGILLASTIVSSGLAVWAVRAEKLASANAVKAQTALKAEEQQRKLAQENEAKANSEAIKSREVATFLEDMLNGVEPTVARGRDTALLKEILDKTAARIGTELKESPDVRADICMTIGNTYYQISEYVKAEEMFRDALRLRTDEYGDEDLQVAECLFRLGELLFRQHQGTEGDNCLRKALQIRRDNLGEQHRDSVELLICRAVNLEEEIEKQTATEQAIELNRQLGNDDRLSLVDRFHQILWNIEDRQERRKLIRELETLLLPAITKVRGNHNRRHDEYQLLVTLAGLYFHSSDHEKSIEVLRRQDSLYSELHGHADPHTKTNLSFRLTSVGRFTQASATMQQALGAIKHFYGDTNRGMELMGLYSRMLALTYLRQGKKAEAHQAFVDALSYYTSGGNEHNNTAGAYADLGHSHMRQNNYQAATVSLQSAYEAEARRKHRSSRRSTSVRIQKTFEELGLRLLLLNRTSDHREVASWFLAKFKQTRSPTSAISASNLLLFHPATPLDLVEQASALTEELLNQEVKDIEKGWLLLCHGLAKYRQRDYEQAGKWLRRATESSRSDNNESWFCYLTARAFLALTEFQQGNTAEAERMLDILEVDAGLFTVMTAEQVLDIDFPTATVSNISQVWLSLQEAMETIRGSSIPDANASNTDQTQLLLTRLGAAIEKRALHQSTLIQGAAVAAWAGDWKLHDRICDSAMRSYGDAFDQKDVEQWARAILVAPSPSPALLRFATTTLQRDSTREDRDTAEHTGAYRLALGMAAYRNHDFLEAERRFTLARTDVRGTLRGTTLFYRAMARHRLGDVKGATEDFESARYQYFGDSMPNRGKLSPALLDADNVYFWLAHIEAAALLGRSCKPVGDRMEYLHPDHALFSPP